MEAFSVRTNITLADWQALQKAWARKNSPDEKYLPAILVLVACALGAYALVSLFDKMGSPIDTVSLIVGMVMGIALIVWRLIQMRRRARPDADGSVLGEQVYEFSPQDVRMRRKSITAITAWSVVKSIESTPQHIFIWIDRVAALIIPVRDLPPGYSIEAAVARLKEFASQVSPPAPTPNASHPASQATPNADALTKPSATARLFEELSEQAGAAVAQGAHERATSTSSQTTRQVGSDAGDLQHTVPSSGWGAGSWPKRTVADRTEEAHREQGTQGTSHAAYAEAAALLPLRESSQAMGLLGAAGRLWSLRRLTGSLPAVSDWVFCVLIAGTLALWVVLDWAANGVEAKFWPYSVPYVAWFALLGFAMAWVFSRRSYPVIAFRNALLVIVLLAPVVIIAAGLSEWVVPEQALVAVQLGIGVYVIVYLARAAHSLTGKPQVPVAVASFLLIFATSWFNSEHGITPGLWYAEESTADESAADVDGTLERGESLLFEQAARIDAAVARIKSASSDKPQVYFVGFAGFGGQRVFAEEIKLAAYNVGRRYGSSERSVLLINDRRDLDKNPLATVAGLRHALKGVAARMNVDRDVLFLALSSHGSDDPQLSVSNGALRLNQLDGNALASALKESGIKRKVIVISACHAGAFIDVLRDDHTVILTAAAPERTSFGCSDDRDLTYFGEAFYRDALPSTPSLRAAFEQATQNIETREKAEDIKPSNPQAFYGAETATLLTEIEQPAPAPQAPTPAPTTRTAP